MLLAEFKVEFKRWLNEAGELEQSLPEECDLNILLSCYDWMQQVRLFDAKAIALQRTGKISTYPSTLGQEAIGVGIGLAMEATDVFCPYYREMGAQLIRGVSMKDILCYWGGDERGMQAVKCTEDLPFCVPIASQTLHAVGIATAMKLRKQKRAVVVTIGDGGTSRGDFYEALNVAGVWHLPVVFVINNNQYAISVGVEKQTAAQTLAQKSIAAGLPCLQIEGNDVIGVRESVREALKKARRGEGAMVIEAVTYRLADHTTADQASRYRSEAEVAAKHQAEPLGRLEKYLRLQNRWDEALQARKKQAVIEKINQAVEAYLALEKRCPSSMFDHLYETLPPSLKPQKALLEHV